ncbi:sigma-70 family RNA polymerase sigma factor [Allorhizocola rhizosphaerae]|uniref:sigma-70 family RNA polymerase sigma factor n=1 Tax=Allorhizocola rhizosphaerae TaxID=1872709 RepID=UPI0013C2EF70|nr:sigma-70 family RNA polymerase sigma factor [Allorhizocola rhizosphaerae]
MTIVLGPELESDAYLISLVRGGDVDAFGRLYERHVGAAKRLARVLAHDPSDADDLVAETFTKVLAAMRAGRGPDTAFRAYVLTTLRHTLYDRTRRDRRVEFTDDLTHYESLSTPDDPLIGRLETSYAARAFARLPERWRTVLWHTEVEGESPAQIAPLLGLTPNGVAALAYRARERLRQMYLQEHIDISDSPRCHWTGMHLPGYVRAQLARRDRAKVEDHLAVCQQCRLLHRELTEENSGLRGVLAGLLLGSAARGYLGSAVVERSIGSVLTGLGAMLVLLWRHVTEWCAQAVAFVAGLGFKLYHLPRKLIERYGPGNVAAASSLVAAGLTGVVVFAAVVIDTDRPQPPPDNAMPRPAPSQRPSVAASATAGPTPSIADSSKPPPIPAPTGHGPITTVAGAPAVAQDVAQVRLIAGQTGVLPIAVRMPEASKRAESLSLRVPLPPGMSLADPDAGDGWECTGSGAVSCARPMLGRGRSTVARLVVRVDRGLTGYQSIKIQAAAGDAASETVTRVPIAPPGMRVGYAALGRLGFALGGNALLACRPRPVCLAEDNNRQEMHPARPEGREPMPPAGLADDVAVSGARLAFPKSVRWAGLMVASSGAVPGHVWLHGPQGWRDLNPVDGFVDVTDAVREGGAGDWWVAVPSGELPSGQAMWSGWSLVVAYDDPAAEPGELAIYMGPAPVREGQEVFLGTGEGGPVDLGLVLWDGDRGLTDDTLTLDAQLHNVGAGSNASSVQCAFTKDNCAWPTPGVDVIRHRATANRDGTATLRTGNDPMVVGLMVLLATAS